MPQPPEVEAAAARLTRLYEDAEIRLARQLRDAISAGEGRRASRLRALSREIERELDRLEAASRLWITTDLLTVFVAGAEAAAVEEATFTQLHREAAQQLADRSWTDVLRRTRYVRRDTKEVLRRLARSAAERTVLEGVPAQASGARLAEAARESGFLTVRYRDGARHSISDWADTNARTTTATAFNEGTFTQAEVDGTFWMECFDGPGCGLERHGVPPYANGLVLSLEEAKANPIAHPRCARSWSPRPDITNRSQARAATTDRARAAEEAAQDALLARQRLVGGQRPGYFSVARQERRAAVRARQGGRTPRAPRRPRTASRQS